MSEHVKILIVEQHNLSRVGLSAALQRVEGFEVVGEAATAEQALEQLLLHQPDVTILDIDLPDYDGIELIRVYRHEQLRLGKSASDIQGSFLILTTHNHASSVMAAFAAGADSYTLKDTSLSQLIEAIRITHEGSSWIDPKIARLVLQETRKASQRSRAPKINMDTHDSVDALNNSVLPAELMTEIEMSTTIAIKALKPEYQEVIDSYPLTEREMEVLELIVCGCTNNGIAQQLNVTPGTVKTHVRNILVKLCAHDRTQAAVRALRAGLIS
ncbi:response regulator transcription factor [filamentous cyanobacterium LEGE 11480]|uniref:Response regulator transcription factor n=2 Tax=Romeriopsis TaxID=2992131 RepID=A0A928VPD4_9CYAN|nr:response regulator transcription factor [Romeriopsis navalis LEGE 11480]